MRQEEITAIFDAQAASYDQQWSKTAPTNAATAFLVSHFILERESRSAFFRGSSRRE
jgi:hypothetical protein